MMSPDEAAFTALWIMGYVEYATVQLAFTLRLGTQRTVGGLVAFAPPAPRTSSAANAIKNTKPFRLFKAIRSLIMEPPLSSQWEIVILSPPTSLRAGPLPHYESPCKSGRVKRGKTVSMTAWMHLSSGKNKSADCTDHADEERNVLLNFGATSLEYNRIVYNK